MESIAVFECTICSRVERVPLKPVKELTAQRVRMIASDHLHLEKGGSGLENLTEDVQGIIELFDPQNIKKIEPALQRRNLKLRVE
ncbi:MAG: hypothetical protein ACRD4V_02850 [Candidatus Acidiferrales bacterium]